MPELVNKGIGLAKAFAGGASAYTNREELQAKAAELKLRKNVANAKNDPNAIQAQMEALQAQNKAIIGKQAKTETYDALRMYSKTGKVDNLNRALQSNPAIRNAWRGITSLNTIDPAQDQALLNKAGITKFNPFIHLKGIMPNGEAQVVDMQNMMLGTGFLSSSSGLSQQELDQMIQEGKLFDTDSDSTKPGPLERDAKYLSGVGAQTGSGGTSEQSFAQGLYDEKTIGNVAGQLEAANKAGADLDATFAETGGFMNTPMTEENRLLAAHGIHSLERLYRIEIPSKQMGDIVELGALTELADIAVTKLTPEVTGKLDTMFQTAKNYLSNSVEDVDKIEARSAYSMFRNTMRHTLFGSALTPAEIKSFNETLGTLSQKYPAVISQFKTALEHTKATIEGLYGMNDPRLIHYYGGTSKQKLGGMIRRLDNVMANLKLQETKEDPLVTPEAAPEDIIQTPPDKTESTLDNRLNSIFGPVPGAQ